MNCLRVKSDGEGNIRPVKPDRFKEQKRIDGAIALILAVSRAIHFQQSVYESRGLMIL
jgi:phage terminase large subunit-like protein